MEVLNEDIKKPVRSALLTVLCILTFIGSGWGLVKAIQNFASADFAATTVNEAMEEAQSKLEEQNEVPSFVSKLFGSISEGLTPENIRKMSVFELISNALTLFGGILMWNLNRKGFWSYLIGIAILILAPMIIFHRGIIGLIASGAVGFFGVIFIVLYGVNLKQMK